VAWPWRMPYGPKEPDDRQMSFAPDEPPEPAELPPLDREELPPLDRDSSDADELADEELGELLPPLDSYTGDDDVDEVIDTEVELAHLPEGPDADAEIDLGFDPVDLLQLDREHDDRDDALGLDDFDGSSEFDSGEPERARADEPEHEGDFGELVAEGDLPELDADEPAEDDEERWGTLGIVSAESELSEAPERWPSRFALGAPERCFALSVSDGVCAAASADLIWVDQAHAAPVRTAVDGTRISSLALVGREPKIALCVTGLGRLFRRARTDSGAERVDDWRRAAELLGSGPEGIELCPLGSDAPHSVVARLSSGALLRSDDTGVTWVPIESELLAFVISQTGAPLAALSKGGERLSLSVDGGRSFKHVELSPPALAVASGEAPLLAAAGSVIAIADAERGLVVSSDSGRTFRVVRGANNATAISAGFCAERPSVWVALYHEARDRTSIALVDVTRAEATIIGVIETPELDVDGAGERSRVERLWWDGTHLWAAGGFGVAVFWPPAGKLAGEAPAV
jgi:hypothetical protein